MSKKLTRATLYPFYSICTNSSYRIAKMQLMIYCAVGEIITLLVGQTAVRSPLVTPYGGVTRTMLFDNWEQRGLIPLFDKSHYKNPSCAVYHSKHPQLLSEITSIIFPLRYHTLVDHHYLIWSSNLKGFPLSHCIEISL